MRYEGDLAGHGIVGLEYIDNFVAEVIQSTEVETIVSVGNAQTILAIGTRMIEGTLRRDDITLPFDVTGLALFGAYMIVESPSPDILRLTVPPGSA